MCVSEITSVLPPPNNCQCHEDGTPYLARTREGACRRPVKATGLTEKIRKTHTTGNDFFVTPCWGYREWRNAKFQIYRNGFDMCFTVKLQATGRGGRGEPNRPILLRHLSSVHTESPPPAQMKVVKKLWQVEFYPTSNMWHGLCFTLFILNCSSYARAALGQRVAT